MSSQADIRQVEWRTVLVLVLCYTLFVVATVWLPLISPLIAVCVLATVIALHSSLQHEVLHGHPFSHTRLNEALVFPAIGLFIPYQRFRDTHLQHHFDPNLTDPYDDPESNFLSTVRWAQTDGVMRRVLAANATLLGRITVGPFLGTVTFWIGDLRLMRMGNRAVLRGYVLHAIGVALVLWWMFAVSNLSVLAYLIGAYAGLSILKIRTFLEHRAHDTVQGRTVVIEDRGLLAFLFLNNNYHSVHHAHPKVPWYDLPAVYAVRRDRYLAGNRGYVYHNYAQVFAQYFVRAKDPIVHPFLRLEPREERDEG